jgi:hypothetical protein
MMIYVMDLRLKRLNANTFLHPVRTFFLFWGYVLVAATVIFHFSEGNKKKTASLSCCCCWRYITTRPVEFG